MYDFEAEYRRIFETPLEEIKEKWYGDLQIYRAIGVCKPDKESVSDLQKALKVMGYPTQVKERDGQPYLVPQRETQKQPPARRHEDRER